MLRYHLLARSFCQFSYLTQRIRISHGFCSSNRITVFTLFSLLVFPVGHVGAHEQVRVLLLMDGEHRELTRGQHIYDSIYLGRDSSIILTGNTAITAAKMALTEKARIIYKKDLAVGTDQQRFKLTILNGEDIKGTLTIDVSGAEGESGSAGADGKSVYGSLHGGPGTKGTTGEKAMHLDVTLLDLSPNSYVKLIANGGKGGPGGDGGEGRYIGSSSGNGGKGGPGGNGGDAGNIDVRLLYDEGLSDREKGDLMDLLKNIEAKTVGGAAGRVGSGGKGARNPSKGTDNGKDGPPGDHGKPGKAGLPFKRLVGKREAISADLYIREAMKVLQSRVDKQR